MKSFVQFKQIATAIQCGEGNVSMRPYSLDTVYLDYHKAMYNALSEVNQQIKNNEADKNFYTLLLNRIDFGVIVLDSKKDVVWINKSALEVVGRQKVCNLADIRQRVDILANVMEDLSTHTSKMIKLSIEDGERNLSVTLTTIEIRGRELDIYTIKDVQYVVDMTEDKAWKQLVQVLTHEMMNSLSPIISLSESLSQEEEDIQLLVKAMGVIHQRSKGLVSFIQNYKKIAQVPEPQLTLFLVRDFLQDIIRLGISENISIDTIIVPSSLRLFADRVLMEQVFVNLLKNAQEACSHTLSPKIWVRANQKDNGQVEISISDNGIGIELEVLHKIFTPFFTTKNSGSGIGLSICRQIILKHGGTLTVSSVVGNGCTFTIVI